MKQKDTLLESVTDSTEKKNKEDERYAACGCTLVLFIIPVWIAFLIWIIRFAWNW